MQSSTFVFILVSLATAAVLVVPSIDGAQLNEGELQQLRDYLQNADRQLPSEEGQEEQDVAVRAGDDLYQAVEDGADTELSMLLNERSDEDFNARQVQADDEAPEDVQVDTLNERSAADLYNILQEDNDETSLEDRSLDDDDNIDDSSVTVFSTNGRNKKWNSWNSWNRRPAPKLYSEKVTKAEHFRYSNGPFYRIGVVVTVSGNKKFLIMKTKSNYGPYRYSGSNTYSILDARMMTDGWKLFSEDSFTSVKKSTVNDFIKACLKADGPFAAAEAMMKLP